MAYEYERDVIDELEQMGADYESNEYFNMSIEVEEVYRKAKYFDQILNLPETYGYAEDYAEDVDVTLNEYMEDK